MQRQSLHLNILLAATLLVALVMAFVPPIPQPEFMHRFADQRSFLGIPNFLNVISSLIFLAASAYGFRLLYESRNGREKARFEYATDLYPYAVLFLGVGLTAIGSMAYHLNPENATLVWDRLPMSLAFASLAAIIIGEYVNRKAGLLLLPVLLALGIYSVVSWYLGELEGLGDLRLYLLVQFYPLLAAAYILFFFPSRYSRGNRFGWVLLLYVLAKAAELLDAPIYQLLQQTISGHTLKHLIAGLSVFVLAEMLRCRVPLNLRANDAMADY